MQVKKKAKIEKDIVINDPETETTNNINIVPNVVERYGNEGKKRPLDI
jgi:hypothetical protein